MKRKKWSIVKLLTGFMNRVSGDHVGAYATQSAYFLILSFIPCILFLTTLVRYTPLTYNVVRDAIIAFIPEESSELCAGDRSGCVQKEHRDRSTFRSGGSVVGREGITVYHQWPEYHLSCKRNP